MTPDRFTAHLALAILGSLAVATVIGGIVLAVTDRSLPGEIIAIGSGAAGVIGGMFSSIGRTNEPTPVVVANQPEDAVPTTDVKPKK